MLGVLSGHYTSRRSGVSLRQVPEDDERDQEP